MMFSRMHTASMMNHGAPACAGAASSCTHTSMQSAANNTIILSLDAILVASIIICALLGLAILGISLVLLVLALLVVLVVLLVCDRDKTPKMRRSA